MGREFEETRAEANIKAQLRKNKRNQRKNRIACIVGACLLIFALLVAAVSMWTGQREHRELRAQGIEITTIVLHQGSGPTRDRVYVSYVVSDRVYQGSVLMASRHDARRAVGEELLIYVDANDPSRIALAGRDPAWERAVQLLIFIAVAGVLFVVAFVKTSPKRYRA